MKTNRKRNKKSLPQLAWGTIKSPYTSLVEEELLKIKAKKESRNDFTNVLDIVGNLGMQIGTDMMLSGIGGAEAGGSYKGKDIAGKVDVFAGNNKDWLQPLMSSLPAITSQFAYGGEILEPNAEVEGEEVAELPNGNLLEFEGNSHENGGIPINLPQGTDVFSKRIKIDGITLANRKKKRKGKQVTLEDLLNANPTDVLIKNSLMRTQVVNGLEENFDERIQDVVSKLISNSQLQQSINQEQGSLFEGNPNMTNEDSLNIQGQGQMPLMEEGQEEDVNQMLNPNEEEELQEYAYGGRVDYQDDKRKPQRHNEFDNTDVRGIVKDELPLYKVLNNNQRKNHKHYNYKQTLANKEKDRRTKEFDYELKQINDIQNDYEKEYDNIELNKKKYGPFTSEALKRKKRIANIHKKDDIEIPKMYIDEKGRLKGIDKNSISEEFKRQREEKKRIQEETNSKVLKAQAHGMLKSMSKGYFKKPEEPEKSIYSMWLDGEITSEQRHDKFIQKQKDKYLEEYMDKMKKLDDEYIKAEEYREKASKEKIDYDERYRYIDKIYKGENNTERKEKMKRILDDRGNNYSNFLQKSIEEKRDFHSIDYDENISELLEYDEYIKNNDLYAYGGRVPYKFNLNEDEQEDFPEPLNNSVHPLNTLQGYSQQIDEINNNLNNFNQNNKSKFNIKTAIENAIANMPKNNDVSPVEMQSIGMKDVITNRLDKGLKNEDVFPYMYKEEPVETPETHSDILKKLLKKYTIGDAIQLFGTYKGMTDPMKNVLENRAGDRPNINYYQNYGKDGLKKLDQTKQLLQELKDRQLQQLGLSRHQGIQRGRNSARSVNTMNALNLATDFGINQAEQNVQSQYAQQLASIIAQESQKLDQRDRMVMQGEGQADMNNRRDRDNFYSEKGKAEASRNSGIKEIGMSLNDMKSREFNENLMEQLSRYGLKFDENGKLVADKNYKGVSTGQVDTGKAKVEEGKANKEKYSAENKNSEEASEPPVSELLNNYYKELEGETFLSDDKIENKEIIEEEKDIVPVETNKESVKFKNNLVSHKDGDVSERVDKLLNGVLPESHSNEFFEKDLKKNIIEKGAIVTKSEQIVRLKENFDFFKPEYVIGKDSISMDDFNSNKSGFRHDSLFETLRKEESELQKEKGYYLRDLSRLSPEEIKEINNYFDEKEQLLKEDKERYVKMYNHYSETIKNVGNNLSGSKMKDDVNSYYWQFGMAKDKYSKGEITFEELKSKEQDFENIIKKYALIVNGAIGQGDLIRSNYNELKSFYSYDKFNDNKGLSSKLSRQNIEVARQQGQAHEDFKMQKRKELYDKRVEDKIKRNEINNNSEHQPNMFNSFTDDFENLGIKPKSSDIIKEETSDDNNYDNVPLIFNAEKTRSKADIEKDEYGTYNSIGGNFVTNKPLVDSIIQELFDIAPELRKKFKVNGKPSNSSAMGKFQITAETLNDFGKVLGENWKQQKYNVENQRKLARAIYEKRKRYDLSKTWEGLKKLAKVKDFGWVTRTGAFSNVPFEEFEKLIDFAEHGIGEEYKTFKMD